MAQSLTLLTIILPQEKSHMLYKKVTTHTKKSHQVTPYAIYNNLLLLIYKSMQFITFYNIRKRAFSALSFYGFTLFF